MKRLLRHFLPALSLCVAVAFAGPWTQAEAQTNTAGTLDEGEREVVERIQDYLSEIDTLHARFLQVSEDGASAEGEVWVDRPGRLRFEYDPPHPALLVSNGRQLLYLDRDLEETSYIPISETPLWFLLKEDIDVADADDYRVAAVEQGEGEIHLDIVQPGGTPGQPGSVRLTFADSPLELKQWRIVDQQGATTEVILQNLRQDVRIDRSKFDFGAIDRPDLPTPGRRF